MGRDRDTPHPRPGYYWSDAIRVPHLGDSRIERLIELYASICVRAPGYLDLGVIVSLS